MSAQQAEVLELDRLQRAAGGALEDLELTDGLALDRGLREILDTGTAAVPGILRRAVRSGVVLLAVVLLCGLTEEVSGALGAEQSFSGAEIAGALAVTAAAVADVHALVGLGREALDSLWNFSKVLLPTVTAAVAASRTPGRAAARQLATMLLPDVLLTLIDRLLLPLVYAYVAACTAYAALGNEGLRRVAELIRWAVRSMLTGVLLSFVGYLTVSGVIAGNTDAMALKAAKLTISGMVPVVRISPMRRRRLCWRERACYGMRRAYLGCWGCWPCASCPFSNWAYTTLSIRWLRPWREPSPADDMGLIDRIGGAFGLVLGMTGAGALLLLVSMVSAVTAAAGGGV